MQPTLEAPLSGCWAQLPTTQTPLSSSMASRGMLNGIPNLSISGVSYFGGALMCSSVFTVEAWVKEKKATDAIQKVIYFDVGDGTWWLSASRPSITSPRSGITSQWWLLRSGRRITSTDLRLATPLTRAFHSCLTPRTRSRSDQIISRGEDPVLLHRPT